MALHAIKPSAIHTVADTGIASPSIAIARGHSSEIGLSGTVTLLAHKSKIDPKVNPVYDRDARSPRWKFSITETREPIPEKIDKLAGDLARHYMGALGRTWVEQQLKKLRSPDTSIDRVASTLMTPGLRKELDSKGISDYDEQRQHLSNRIREAHKIQRHIIDSEGNRYELTPENEKLLIDKMKVRGIKLGEIGGYRKAKSKGNWWTILDSLITKRFGSLRQLKYEANKKLVSEREGAHDLDLIPKELKERDIVPSVRRLCVRALRQGKLPSIYIKDEKAKGKDPIGDDFSLRYGSGDPKKDHPKIGQILDKWVYDLKHNLKQPYFEAKPQRFFRLNDFAAAVVPDHEKEVAEKLRQHGLKVYTYNPSSSAGDRATMTRRAAEENDLLFSEDDLGLEDLAKSELIELFEEPLAKSEEPSSPCVLTVITNGTGKMLFIKRNDNKKWSLCAGHIEGDEDSETAARREILEETGLKPEYLTRIPGCDFPNMTCFTAQCQGTPHGRNDPDNEGTPQWVDIRHGIPANIWDNLAGPQDDRNVVHKLFSKALGIHKSELGWLDAGFLDLSKAIADIPVGKMTSVRNSQVESQPVSSWDYSHLLTPEQRANNYSLQVHKIKNPFHNTNIALVAGIYHEGGRVGKVFGAINPSKKSIEPHSNLDKEHRDRGLGVKAYEALYAHAKRKEGVKQVVGFVHSPDAHNVHLSLARRHGLDYSSNRIGPEWYSGYDYELKSELEFDKSELSKAEVPKETKLVHPPKESKENNLLVTHNLSAENLKHAEELGGLAAPSIAIHHKNHPFDNYGEISLVAHPSLVDPEYHVPVFNADAYSARHPKPNYRINKKKMDLLVKELHPHAETVRESSHLLGSFPENVENRGAQDAIADRSMSAILKAAYLHEKGHAVKQLKRPVPINYSFVKKKPMQDFFAQYGLHLPEYHDEDDIEGQKAEEEYLDRMTEAFKKTKPNRYRFEEALDDNGKLHPWVVRDMVKDASNLGKTEPDRWGTQEAADKKLKDLGLEDDFDRWAINKVKPTQDTPYIPKGTRKIPYTMENILKAVVGGGVAGTEKSGAMYGTGFARAKGAKKFSSLDQIRKYQGQLVSHEEMKAVKDKLSDQFSKIADKLKRYHSTGGGFHAMDAMVSALGESFKKGRSLGYELRRDGFDNVPPHLVDELRQYGNDLVNSGTEYFEAKPQRQVQLREFHGAVVPHDVKPDVLDILKRHGLNVKTYKRGDAQDRLRVVNEMADENNLKLSEEELNLEHLAK